MSVEYRPDNGWIDGRRAGVLAHPTSLPGPARGGNFGPGAVRFLDWCVEAGIGLWQVLPLTPVGAGLSPYSGPSTFAGNPRLISVELLREEPWADDPPTLRDSWASFHRSSTPAVRRELQEFLDDRCVRSWLDDWALYAALAEQFGGTAWHRWDRELRLRHPSALERARRELSDEIAFHRYLQFLFRKQWDRLRGAAHRRGILVLGDLPFYVAHDSADVWAHREQFALDAEGVPLRIAGVPPDYFSETGQLWGNPVYDWGRMAADGFSWWIERIRAQLRLTDLLRLDHFRAFEAYWTVAGDARTAIDGAWTPGPGRAFFDALRDGLSADALPLIAEDLGFITEEVHSLRREIGLPGMRVAQFGFDEGQSEHHPRNYPADCVAYTGTHDNDTARGWIDSLDDEGRARVVAGLEGPVEELPRRLVEAVYSSEALLAVVPLQDHLGLGSEARMNTPSVAEGNWLWRVDPGALDADVSGRMRRLSERSGRRTCDRLL